MDKLSVGSMVFLVSAAVVFVMALIQGDFILALWVFMAGGWCLMRETERNNGY